MTGPLAGAPGVGSSPGIGYNGRMVTLNAHFDGKTIILDEPVTLPLRSGARLKVRVEMAEDEPAGAAAPRRFQPLNIQIDPELSNAIALDPAFDVGGS